MMNSVFLLTAPFISGCLGAVLLGKHSKKIKIPGLLFHSVLPKPSLNLSHFSSKTFQKFLHLIKNKNYSPITLSNVKPAIIENNIPRPLLITFDDGLENIYHHAIPYLDEYNFKATIFCVAGFLGKTSTWDVYRKSEHLSVEQVRKISNSGHEIGSHTLTHCNCTFLNQSDLVRELRESKKILEEVTGKRVTSVSFPHGSWNERVWKTAMEEGYTRASIYRGHFRSHENQYPVYSAGRFDSEHELIEKIQKSTMFSPSVAFSKIASQFAKGTPLWKYRKEYDVTRSTIIDG